MIRSVDTLAKSSDPIEQEVARYVLERFHCQGPADLAAHDLAEKWWRKSVLLWARRPENEGFGFGLAEKAAIQDLWVQSRASSAVERRGWKRRPDGTVVPAHEQKSE